MRVFISWSGDRSKALADILRRWFPSVIQAIRPYFSPDDLAKGSRWNSEIAKELDASKIGLLILTPENQNAPWLLFEAGALAKNLDRSKVCPILFGGLEPTDVQGPLVQFQAAKFESSDMKRVVKMMNTELGESSLTSDVIDSVFDMWWPKLEVQVVEELKKHESAGYQAPRAERDILEEVLALTRTFAREGRPRRMDIEHPAFDELIEGVSRLIRLWQLHPADPESTRAMHQILRSTEFLTHRGMSHDKRHHHLRQLMHEVEIGFMDASKAKAASVGNPDDPT